MAELSGTYNFQSVQIELLIREAYENIGIAPEFLTPQQLESARRSINLILLEWMNKSTNLWTLKSSFLALNEYQNQYRLNHPISDITAVNLRTSNRKLGGVPSASSGNAENAFDNNAATACIQDVANGTIAYDYGEDNKQRITFVGIQSNIDTTYSIILEYSNDTVNWQQLQVIESQTYVSGSPTWFDIVRPINARAYRIRETGGSILNIQEIYFNNNVLDIPMSGISRDEYLKLPQKNLTGRPSSYYFDRAINPVISLWPTPSGMYQTLQYSYKRHMQDVGLYTNAIEIPSSFYPVLVAALSFKLALKFNPQLAEILNQEYQNTFADATVEDSENIKMSIRPNWSTCL